MWLTVLTQTPTPSLDPTTLFAQLGIASIICALLFVWGLTLWRDNKDLREQILEAKDSQIALVDRIAPLLAEAADLIRVATEQQRQIQSSEKMRGLERVVGQLQNAVNDMQRRD